MTVLAGLKSTPNSRLAVRYIDDNIVLSDTQAWTYLRVPTVSYEFLTDADRVNIAQRIYLALAALVTGSDPIEAHLLVTTRPVNPDFWASELATRVQRWRPAPGWDAFLAQMTEHLHEEEYLRKEVYLGVCLGNRKGRGAAKNDQGDFFAPLMKLLGKTEKALGFEDDVVPDSEIVHWTRKANVIQGSLAQSHIHASPAHRNAVAWLVTKPLYPEMVCPNPTAATSRVWGPGEIESLGEGVIANGHKTLAITQSDPDTGEDLVGYTATLCFSRFPDVLAFPDQEPWMHFASSLAYPVDLSSRFTIVPAAKVQKDVSRKLAEAKDQATHIAETGASVPLDVQEQYDRATALEFLLARDRQPWVYGRHRLRVSAPTEDLLRARVRKIIEHYRDLAIDVVWPSGDQMDLLCEAMPGDRVRTRAYHQRQELSLIGGGMPTASSEVGDAIENGKGWIGPVIGETTSRVRSVVHFSPHVAIARNNAPGVAITGSPGGGKSFCAFTLAHQDAMQGVWTIYIDPKADAKPMGSLPGLGAPKVFDLRDGNDGMLDPFSMADSIPEAKLLALETISLMLGGASMSEERQEALAGAVEKVALGSEPSLLKVVEVLSASEETHARNLGTVLRTMKDLQFARLCFAPNAGAKIRPEDGLTVITLLGLALPGAEEKAENYGYENRLAVAVMYLLTRYARRLMLNMDKNHPKAIYIDEAWAITSTPQGAKLIPEIARMGRSHNTALVLVSQNAGDLMKEAVTNSISTVFAFRSKDAGEIENVLRLLGAEVHDGHASAVRDLRNGECLMRDVDGRLARVQIDSWNRDLKETFDTNPETRGKSAGEQAEQQADMNREWGA